jgi:hypothetical protein
VDPDSKYLKAGSLFTLNPMRIRNCVQGILTLFSILCEMTLMLAWNEAEAGRILETYKLYENKPPDMIMEKTGTRVQDLRFFPFFKTRTNRPI